MMTTEHWAILGQSFTVMFALFGIVGVGYLAARELQR